MPSFLLPELFSFPFYSNPLSFFTVKLASYCFTSSHSVAPSALLPSQLFILPPPFLTTFCWFCFMLTFTLSLCPPPSQHLPTTPETELVYSVFSTSRLCAAVTLIFLSNICFFHLLIFFFFLLLPTLLPLSYNLKRCFSKLHFESEWMREGASQAFPAVCSRNFAPEEFNQVSLP